MWTRRGAGCQALKGTPAGHGDGGRWGQRQGHTLRRTPSPEDSAPVAAWTLGHHQRLRHRQADRPLLAAPPAQVSPFPAANASPGTLRQAQEETSHTTQTSGALAFSNDLFTAAETYTHVVQHGMGVDMWPAQTGGGRPSGTLNGPAHLKAATLQGVRGLSAWRLPLWVLSKQVTLLGKRLVAGWCWGAGATGSRCRLSGWGVEDTATDRNSDAVDTRGQGLLSAGPLLVHGNNAQERGKEEHPFFNAKIKHSVS